MKYYRKGNQYFAVDTANYNKTIPVDVVFGLKHLEQDEEKNYIVCQDVFVYCKCCGELIEKCRKIIKHIPAENYKEPKPFEYVYLKID